MARIGNSTSLISLRSRADTEYISHGTVVLATRRDGTLTAQPGLGLFVDQTRLVSTLRYRIDGRQPQPISLSSIQQHRWMGYYAVEFDGETGELFDEIDESRNMLELRVTRHIVGGLHEDIDLENFGRTTVEFELQVEFDADFADISETQGERKQRGEVSHEWGEEAPGVWLLERRYRATHLAEHRGVCAEGQQDESQSEVQDESQMERTERAIALRITRADSPAHYADNAIRFRVRLRPRERWHACLLFASEIDGRCQHPADACLAHPAPRSWRQVRHHKFLGEAARFSTPASQTLSATVDEALTRARADLGSLRMYAYDEDERTWVMAAGMPVYVGIFGRDILTSAWQAATLDPGMMRGSLRALARTQGRQHNPWRDEQPGRMLHQATRAPLATLGHNPYARYYGSNTTSAFYPFVVSALWHWTADPQQVEPFIEPALRGLEWLDKYADSDGAGFYRYQTCSEQGLKNQGWKDSEDAILYEDGSMVENPIATSEEQGYAYVAKFALSETLWWLGRRDEAKKLFAEARELKKRFNEAFWMPDEGFLAMALDSDGPACAPLAPMRGIASPPGSSTATWFGRSQTAFFDRICSRAGGFVRSLGTTWRTIRIATTAGRSGRLSTAPSRWG